jgi:hypothetical protein
LFTEHDLEKSQNLKLILAAFEQLLGLKINFHKSELCCFGEAQDSAALYAVLFGCGQSHFPIRCFGDSDLLSEINNCRMEISGGKTVEAS